MSIAVLNSDANLTAKTLMAAENADTVTGLKTFNRGAAAPFACDAASTKVANLDADKLDGLDSAALAQLATANAFTDATDSTSAVTGAIKTAGGLGVVKNLSVGATIKAIGGLIEFPAVQVPSAGVNTLDDYEEGTWTPTIVSSGGGTPTYTTQTGWYRKVGSQVSFGCFVALATFGTLAAGDITIAGLPFASENTANHYAGCSVGSFAGLTSGVVSMGAYIVAGASAVTMVTPGAAAATGMGTLTKAVLSATSSLLVGGIYKAAN